MDLLNRGVIASWHLKCFQITEDYLKKIDRDDYNACWSCHDHLLQQAIKRNDWERDIHEAKFYLGKVKSRNLKSQCITWDPQNLPEGPYIIMEFDSASEQSAGLSEIIALRKGRGNQWKVLFYQFVSVNN